MIIALVYEDKHFRPLHDLLTRVFNTKWKDAEVHEPRPRLEAFSAKKGASNLVNVVRNQWPVLKRHGLPRGSGRRPDVLFCIADADRIHDFVPSVGPPPARPADTDAWHAAAEATFTAYLRSSAPDPEGSPDVHGNLLRWNAESVLLACFDQLNGSPLGPLDDSALQTHLERCAEKPRDTPDPSFVHRHRRPGRCFDELCRAAGVARMTKSGKGREDLIRFAAEQCLPTVMARVPDLQRMADRLIDLSRALVDLLPGPSGRGSQGG